MKRALLFFIFFVMVVFISGCNTGTDVYSLMIITDSNTIVSIYESNDDLINNVNEIENKNLTLSSSESLFIKLEFKEGYEMSKINLENGDLTELSSEELNNSDDSSIFKVSNLFDNATLSVNSKVKAINEVDFNITFDCDLNTNIFVYDSLDSIINDINHLTLSNNSIKIKKEMWFKIVVNEGYILDTIENSNTTGTAITIINQELNMYYLNAIDGDAIITIKTKEKEIVPETVYDINFQCDDNCSVTVYASLDDLNSGNNPLTILENKVSSTKDIYLKINVNEGYKLNKVLDSLNKLELIDYEHNTYLLPICLFNNIDNITTINISLETVEVENIEVTYNVNFVFDKNLTLELYDSVELDTKIELVDNTIVISDQVYIKLVLLEGFILDKITSDSGYLNAIETDENYLLYSLVINGTDVNVEITTKEEVVIEDGYKVEFVCDNNVSVEVFDTQDYSLPGNVTNSTFAKDGLTGEITKSGEGQVNFKLLLSEGYELDEIIINNQNSQNYSNYSNIKGPSETKASDVYRITKITGDIIVEIKTVKRDSNGEYKFTTYYEDKEYQFFVTGAEGTFEAVMENNIVNIICSVNTEVTLSGTLYGSIVVANNETIDMEINLSNCTIISDKNCPILVEISDDVDISAKLGTENFIYDNREYSEEFTGAIYTNCDLKMKGNGTLTIVSKNNNGIHSKDDLTLQKLTLYIECEDNAIKGNDSVTIESGIYTLIARTGDGIKTNNSGLYTSSSLQQGTITINGGNLDIYAACDGIDAAYDVVINESTESPVINIYTDKYSKYSESVTTPSIENLFIRSSSSAYKYSIMYYNSDSDYIWVNSSNSEYVNAGGRMYYYYPMELHTNYQAVYVYVYTNSQTQGQNSSYYATSGRLTFNSSYDTIAYSSQRRTFTWTNYGVADMGPGGNRPGGPGGMQDGNTDKGDYSTKGIKANNQIIINGGIILIESYDDAIHANNDEAIESGISPLGNVTINGGLITITSNDDGLHADNILAINNGEINVLSCYEGAEGKYIEQNSGKLSIISKDDGMNSTATAATTSHPYAIMLKGGYLYMKTGGDGIDANLNINYKGILFDGITCVVISSSNGNSCLDAERGYTYNSGNVIAFSMSNCGFWNEAKNCYNFTGIGKFVQTIGSFSIGNFTTVSISGEVVLAIKMPVSGSYGCVYLGSNSATISKTNTFDNNLDENGVYYK